MTDPDTRQWCARLPSNDKSLYGPYESRQGAIDGIRHDRDEENSDDTEVTIGRVQDCDPGIDGIGIYDLLESMGDQAYNNEWSWVDGTLFEYKDEKAAEIAFRAFLREHITSVYWVMAEDSRETVALPKKEVD